MYSVLSEKEMKKAKEVKKNVIKHQLCHQDYKDCLLLEQTYKHSMNSIQSEKHQLYIVKQNKTSLAPYDDKRYLLDDGITSLPYGHHKMLEIFSFD